MRSKLSDHPVPANAAVLPETGDRRWIAGLRAGRMDILGELYAALVPSLYRFAQRFVAADVAEDVIQDVLIDLWNRREVMVIHGTLRGYLYGAVRRRIAYYLRHEKVRERFAQDASDAVTAFMAQDTGAAPPDDIAQAGELAAAVYDALATLSPRSRLILTMRWIDQLSYPEIADALGLSHAAAKKQGRRLEDVIRPLLLRFNRR